MSDGSRIEWLARPGTRPASWNPIRARNVATGGIGHWCAHVSPGCANCYAERMQPRFGNPIRYAAQDQAKVEMFLDQDVLNAPLRWRRSRTVFVCSMTDLFGVWVSDDWLDHIFAIMAALPQHTFIVLTKRPGRMQAYLARHDIGLRWACHFGQPKVSPEIAVEWSNNGLPNVWLGVSVEDQERADTRIPILLDTPAAVRFVSAEPLLGSVDLRPFLFSTGAPFAGYTVGYTTELGMLHWVIVGGESGPGARWCDVAWIRGIVDQCRTAGVPAFVKQIGSRPGHGDRKGADPSEWPAAIRVREWP